MIFFTSRGGRSNEGTVQIDGMNVGSAFNGGGVAGYGYDTAGAQEVQVTVAGGLGEADRGGPAFNLVPKTGGNNFSRHLLRQHRRQVVAGQQRGRRAAVVRHPERRPRSSGAGTPASRWAGRSSGTGCGSTARRARSATTPTSPAASPTPTPATRSAGTTWPIRASRSARPPAGRSSAARVTSQLTPRNKVSAYFDYQKVCEGSSYAADAEPVPRPRRRLDRAWAASATGRRSRRTRATTPSTSCSSRTRRR